MSNYQKMYFFMENHQLREDLRDDYPNGVYTLYLIRDGKRVATTRPFPLGHVGERVILYNSRDLNCKELDVKITRIEKLNIRNAEEASSWSEKEGWSIEYLAQNPRLHTAWQTTFRLVNELKQEENLR